MSRPTTRSIASAGSESVGSHRQRSSSVARGERSASNPASFSMETNHYDTALPPINFHHAPVAHRRTGSTLKTVMRKIFNRKRQSQTDGVEESPIESYYSSVPARSSGPVEGRSFLAVPTPSDSKRSSPLSEENLQLADYHLSPTALSHTSLPSPGVVSRRRRATLPSVIFSDDESHYACASSAISDPYEDRPHITDQQRTRNMLQDRRRSRSTDALREMVGERPISAAAWPQRSTSVPHSAPNSKSPPLLEESSASDRSARPSTGTTVTSVSRASATPSLVGSDHHPEPMSPFPPNMSNLVHTMQRDDGLTVEQRLNTIEVKMIDLEFAIARMQSSSANSNDNSATERPSRKQAPSSESVTPQMRNKTSAFLGTADRDESPSPLADLPTVRPSSMSTIRPDTMNSRTLRPTPSATSLSDFNGVSIEKFSTLVALLRREQTARRNLESQVATLRDDLRHLQRAALHSMELGTMYPIHSVDSQEFLRFRRALDDSDTSPIQEVDEKHIAYDNASDWDPHGHHDSPFTPPKWEHGQRTVAPPMI
ncbi:hypothetical protein N7532_004452 [Penicillium argentinense]|uniref:Uncharacterized protein n=1 Tax=Penicillium argentinense TaxID=1131581 RepID=A0A9W9FPH9_9EURO|nr:uncharacterized protein N7532_004452 [Penicillium argentinense]KAJ5103923.1 hypothetical protein N7532_004452 [Penicillium argentinense]